MKNIFIGFIYGVLFGILIVTINQPKRNEAYLKDAIITVDEDYIKDPKKLDDWANTVWKQL